MGNIWASWKTTSAGILAILGGITSLIFIRPLDQTVVMAALTAIVGGIGLIFARDNTTTSQQAGAGKTPTE